jgi:hypothetical protein
MKCKLLTRWPIVIAVMVLAATSPGSARVGCTQRGAAGKYGFTLSGWLVLSTGPVPLAAVGAATVDAAGNVTGTEARNVGGGFADETLAGTLTVNPDCTGSMTLRFYENGQLVRTSVLSTVTDSNTRELRMVQKSLTLPNGTVLPVVIAVEARRMFSEDED